MKQLFKQLIIDFHRQSIPIPTPRELELPRLPPNVRKAMVFIGMRRSGKTWSMYQQMQNLMRDGLPQTNLLYINFEDDRLEDIRVSDLHSILDAYFELYPENVDSKDLHFFFDEIHEVSGWEKFIRRLLDSEQMHIYLSGSSAKMLSKEIATSLRGRTITREIFPYNFHEYLIHQQRTYHKNPSSKEKAILLALVQEFIRNGGFPETIGVPPPLHRELLQGYIDTVIYRDIIDRYQVTNSAVLKRFLTHCLQNSSALLSINKLYQSLKSLGYSVSKNSLYEYMNYFEDAYCIFPLNVYHPSQRKSSQKPKKIYPVDQGLITAYGWHQEFRHGARLEATVFSKLRRCCDQLYYYETSDGREIDFLTITATSKIEIIQVTLSLKNGETAEREITALRKAMLELGLKRGTIVTFDEEAVLEYPEGHIECIPSWKFLMTDAGEFK